MQIYTVQQAAVYSKKPCFAELILISPSFFVASTYLFSALKLRFILQDDWIVIIPMNNIKVRKHG